MKHQKVFVVGAGGRVGSSAAYAMALREVINEIVLIDAHRELAEGQAMDISDAAAFGRGVVVRVGDYNQIEDDDIVVICSGAAQQPGQSRLELIDTNVTIMRDVVKSVMAGGKTPFLVVVSNPVDVLTYVALKESGLPRSRVFGTGTALESARLRDVISYKCNVSPANVEAYALGEHGDSTFMALSSARIGSIPLRHYRGFNYLEPDYINKEVSEKVYKIINSKGATHYGIGQVIAEVVLALQGIKPTVMPVCSLMIGEYGLDDVVLSVPTEINRFGVKPLPGFNLSEDEFHSLGESARIIRGVLNQIM